MLKQLVSKSWVIIVLIGVVFLFNIIIRESFKQYANCGSMIEFVPLKPHVICDGIDLLVYKLDGLDSFLTPLLEKTRVALLWGLVAVFAVSSLLLTIIISNLHFFTKIIAFDRQAWKQLFSGLQIWSILMLAFGLIFYCVVNFVIKK